MTLFRNKYRIESTRLPKYDYSTPGKYFITICTKNRERILSGIVNGCVSLSEEGKIVRDCFLDLPNHYGNIEIDEFIVMPDHFHGIIEIKDNQNPEKQHGLSEFVRALKSFSARKINEINGTAGKQIWQSRFYDSIIRSDDELFRIRTYIRDNPKNRGK